MYCVLQAAAIGFSIIFLLSAREAYGRRDMSNPSKIAKQLMVSIRSIIDPLLTAEKIPHANQCSKKIAAMESYIGADVAAFFLLPTFFSALYNLADNFFHHLLDPLVCFCRTFHITQRFQLHLAQVSLKYKFFRQGRFVTKVALCTH